MSAHLSMWGVPDQVPDRGSIGCAYTANQREGIADAAEAVFRQVVELFNSKPQDRASEAALDGLRPASLVHAAGARMANLGSLEVEDRNEAALVARQKALKELQARSRSRLLHEVQHEVQTGITEQLQRLRCALLECFDRSPRMAGTLLGDARQMLSAVTWPSEGFSPHLKRLAMIVAKLSELPTCEDRITPSTYRRVVQDLVQVGWQEADASLDDVLRSLVNEEWQQQSPLLQEFLAELERRCVAFDQRLQEATARLRENARQVREEHEQRASSIALSLTGPTRDETIAGMKAANQCDDMAALSVKLQGQWDLALREVVRCDHPHLDREASLPALVLDLPVEVTVAQWTRVFGRRLGEGHSLYARICMAGASDVITQLWRRASPTCFFEGRDHDLFGMNLTEVAVVRLPPATSPADERTRTQIAELFRRQSTTCHVADGSTDDAEISVVRVNCGFVIGIEAANRALLQCYGEAAEVQHPVHLIGLVPDAFLGAASPGCLALLSEKTERQSSHSRNGANHE